MKNRILDWYFNSSKFIYGSRIYNKESHCTIIVGREKKFSGKNFRSSLVKSTNNCFLKFIFFILDFKLEPNSYHRNQFSGYKHKTKWEKIDNCLHLAWHVGGSHNNENKHITKVKVNKL
jgi:hypothetical protein